MESFAFKQFTVSHSKSAMRVNTDGVLLAAWTNLPPFEKSNDVYSVNNIKSISKSCGILKILDIGTGTGVIALILAQRLSQMVPDGNFKIEGIDIDLPSIEDAIDNFNRSPWRDSLIGEATSIQEFLSKFIIDNGERTNSVNTGKFSLIVTNPPYFTNSSKAPSQRRSAARHNDTLPLDTLIDAASKLLEYDGTLSLILPVEEGKSIIELANNYSLYLSRLCKIKTTPVKSEKRYMMEFKKEEDRRTHPKIEELIIQNTNGTYTEHYCDLISDYYYKDFRVS